MADLLVWELELRGTEDAPVEVISLADDGAVRRVVSQAGGTEAPEVGWWSGALGAGELAAARTLAESDWPVGDQLTSPPAAGAWYVSGPGGRMGLWAAATPQPGDGARNQLSAIRSVAVEAAHQPACVARFTAEWSKVGGQPVPLLTIDALGSERVSLTLDAPAGAPPASFMTDDAEVLGFTGGEMWIPAGTHVYGVLRGWPSPEAGLDLTARLANAAGERIPVTAAVALP